MPAVLRNHRCPAFYAAGEPVCLLGRRYRLRIEPSDRDRAAIQGEEVVLFLRNPENESQRKRCLRLGTAACAGSL